MARRRRFAAIRETKSGVKVRSRYEQRCADLLDSLEIEFIYEPLMIIAGRQYRPDFYLPAHGVFIELCGYNHMPFYRDRISQKQALYEKHKLKAVFINYNGSGSLEATIATELQKLGIDTGES